jgi:hypothetical protein
MTLDQTWRKPECGEEKNPFGKIEMKPEEPPAGDILGREEAARLAYANRQARIPEDSEEARRRQLPSPDGGAPSASSSGRAGREHVGGDHSRNEKLA